MATPFLGVSPRRSAAVVCALVAVAVIGLSNTVGRAEPTGNYRPDLPPAALENGCYPLPDGVDLDLPHQVRTDGDVDTGAGTRRALVLHYDLMDAAGAVDSVEASFVAAGFVAERTSSTRVVLRRDDEQVEVSAEDFPDVAADSPVRGTMELDLPTTPLSPDGVECDDPFSTKRFPPDWKPSL